MTRQGPRGVPQTASTTVHFPPLTGEQALALVDLLDALSKALWDAHGDALVEILCAAALAEPPEDEHDLLLGPDQDDIGF